MNQQAMIDARIDIINNLDPRDGSIKDQQTIAKNLKSLSLLFISDNIEEDIDY